MPTSLNLLQRKLAARVSYLDSAFDRHIVSRVTKRRIDRFALQEGLVSALWQAWGNFCRETIIRSAQGAYTRAGELTTCGFSAHTEAEIAFIARQLSNKATVNRGKALRGNHEEPTWGDPNKLNLIVN